MSGAHILKHLKCYYYYLLLCAFRVWKKFLLHHRSNGSVGCYESKFGGVPKEVELVPCKRDILDKKVNKGFLVGWVETRVAT